MLFLTLTRFQVIQRQCERRLRALAAGGNEGRVGFRLDQQSHKLITIILFLKKTVIAVRRKSRFEALNGHVKRCREAFAVTRGLTNVVDSSSPACESISCMSL
jgi:hypothetical protein